MWLREAGPCSAEPAGGLRDHETCRGSVCPLKTHANHAGSMAYVSIAAAGDGTDSTDNRPLISIAHVFANFGLQFP